MKTIVKILVPLVMIGLAALVAHGRRLSWRDDVGWRGAPAGAAAAWLAVGIAWMLGTNAAMGWRRPWDFTPWLNAPILVDIGRVVAVAVLGPIGEELIFRGVLFGWLVRRGMNQAIGLMLVAAAWAVIHLAYTPAVIAIIFVFGVLLGAARARTRSVIVPIAMHIVWNLYAVW